MMIKSKDAKTRLSEPITIVAGSKAIKRVAANRKKLVALGKRKEE